MKERRPDFFLATKTGLRTKIEAKDQLKLSLERMQVDSVDLIQMHNLTKEEDWSTAMGAKGALMGLIEAKEEGLVKHIGVTGHGTYAASMHLRSLREYDFDSVLLPYNFSMMKQEAYKADFDELYSSARAKGVAIQTIKSIALRRWGKEDAEKRYSWYRPITNEHPLKRAVDYTLCVDGLFLNSTSDATLLETLFRAASAPIRLPVEEEMQSDCEELGMEPLFVRGVSDDV
jgi:predicted aldo/keto reductase-like oxidoreductase